jgi:hypothetical protein
MAEKRNGMGSRPGGLLERPAPRPLERGGKSAELPAAEPGSIETEPARRSRGGAKQPAAKSPAVKGRTIYLHDDLFERILVHAHRRKWRDGRSYTISEYVSAILDRHVPDHRSACSEPASLAEGLPGDANEA